MINKIRKNVKHAETIQNRKITYTRNWCENTNNPIPSTINNVLVTAYVYIYTHHPEIYKPNYIWKLCK